MWLSATNILTSHKNLPYFTPASLVVNVCYQSTVYISTSFIRQPSGQWSARTTGMRLVAWKGERGGVGTGQCLWVRVKGRGPLTIGVKAWLRDHASSEWESAACFLTICPGCTFGIKPRWPSAWTRWGADTMLHTPMFLCWRINPVFDYFRLLNNKNYTTETEKSSTTLEDCSFIMWPTPMHTTVHSACFCLFERLYHCKLQFDQYMIRSLLQTCMCTYIKQWLGFFCVFLPAALSCFSLVFN